MLRLRRRSDGVVVPDVAHRRPGRSAWVCGARACLDTAVRRRAFHRALGGPRKLAVRDPELGALVGSIVTALDDRLALLRRTGDPASAQISALAALQHALRAAGEVA
jgi:hypothetical protein